MAAVSKRESVPSTDTTGQPRVLHPEPGAGASLVLYREALGSTDSTRALAELRTQLPWTQQRIRLYGKYLLQPRLSCWIGDPQARYTYSGTQFHPQPWPAALLSIKQRIEILSGHRFNSVLCNAYRDGRDSMGWHADDEPELGPQPAIASYSLGATRSFQMRPKQRPRPSPPWSLELLHDDLLVMSGSTQQHWQHGIPKRRRVHEWRINLTFRWIQNSQ